MGWKRSGALAELGGIGMALGAANGWADAPGLVVVAPEPSDLTKSLVVRARPSPRVPLLENRPQPASPHALPTAEVRKSTASNRLWRRRSVSIRAGGTWAMGCGGIIRVSVIMASSAGLQNWYARAYAIDAARPKRSRLPRGRKRYLGWGRAASESRPATAAFVTEL